MANVKTVKNENISDDSETGKVVKIDGKNSDNQDTMDVSGLMALLDKTRGGVSGPESKKTAAVGSGFSLELKKVEEANAEKAKKKGKKPTEKKDKSVKKISSKAISEESTSKKKIVEPVSNEEEIIKPAEDNILVEQSEEKALTEKPTEYKNVASSIKHDEHKGKIDVTENDKNSIANVEAAIARHHKPQSPKYSNDHDNGVWPLVGVMVVICLGVFGITYILDQKATGWAEKTVSSSEKTITIPSSASNEAVQAIEKPSASEYSEYVEEKSTNSAVIDQYQSDTVQEEIKSSGEGLGEQEPFDPVAELPEADIAPASGVNINTNTEKLSETSRYELLQFLRE